ncbi:hypothetical protein HELRODRAFT_193094 [Helobdella robusta]|uniref:Uncharacterized protein n=1 Tax=Helobdella robusta TaxID=6412 RepID=T1FUM4_HELRO|nr:hypothetical protein HELRODRAFT_193094 [Helobdella robusta]ESN98113.1 hypothetical protein HELRODRAFT_193094 [Helobdella robusta]
MKTLCLLIISTHITSVLCEDYYYHNTEEDETGFYRIFPASYIPSVINWCTRDICWMQFITEPDQHNRRYPMFNWDMNSKCYQHNGIFPREHQKHSFVEFATSEMIRKIGLSDEVMEKIFERKDSIVLWKSREEKDSCTIRLLMHEVNVMNNCEIRDIEMFAKLQVCLLKKKSLTPHHLATDWLLVTNETTDDCFAKQQNTSYPNIHNYCYPIPIMNKARVGEECLDWKVKNASDLVGDIMVFDYHPYFDVIECSTDFVRIGRG